VGSSEHDNKYFGSIYVGEFFDQLSDHQLLKKDFVLWHWFVGWLVNSNVVSFIPNCAMYEPEVVPHFCIGYVCRDLSESLRESDSTLHECLLCTSVTPPSFFFILKDTAKVYAVYMKLGWV
jgi:hypothetical protein